MSGIRKLAGQTLWYGIPSISSRFLGYLMNLSLPLIFKEPAITADLTLVYAAVAFLNVLYTYGLETAYFRFSQEGDSKKLYSTLSLSLFGSTLFFSSLLWIFQEPLAQLANLQGHTEYIRWMIGILFFDTIATIAFAKLRQEDRPRYYAIARMASVLVNILVVVVFLGIVPRYLQSHPASSLSFLQIDGESGIVWYLIGNFLGSLTTFLLLQKEFRQLQFQFDPLLWKKVMKYSWPLIIVGMGGIVNDMLSRLLYQFVVDLPAEQAKHELGVFGNIIRLSILITIAIQAFRMAAEPFFFNRSKEDHVRETYARVMKYFVVVCCLLFLGISLYIDVIKWFFEAIHRDRWTEGLYVVPLFAMANILLGIYYNLSIWYKLTHRNLTGAFITVGGAFITIVLTLWLIPILHYWGAALAAFGSYLFMVVTSYWLGQKHYPVPYEKGRILFYLFVCAGFYRAHRFLVTWNESRLFNLALATALLLCFVWIVSRVEKKEWKGLLPAGKGI